MTVDFLCLYTYYNIYVCGKLQNHPEVEGVAKFWVMCEEGVIAAIISRGRRGLGTARHFCSAEREVVGVLNVLRRGEGKIIVFIPIL